jgi:hypothetical protein
MPVHDPDVSQLRLMAGTRSGERGKEQKRDGWRGRHVVLCLQHPQKKKCDADFSTTDWSPIQSSRQKPRQGQTAGATCG